VVARGSFRSPVRCSRYAVRARPFRASPRQLGRQLQHRGLVGERNLPGLSGGGHTHRLQATPQPRGLDPNRRRPPVDDHRHARQLQRLRDGESRLGPLPARGRRDQQLAVGALGRAPGHLRVPPLPQRQSPFEEVASAGVALGGGDRISERRRRALARTVAGPRRSSKPVRVAHALDDARFLGHPPTGAPVHARLGSEPGLPLPALPRGAETAAQVDSLRRRLRGLVVHVLHGPLVRLPGKVLVRPGLAAVAGPRGLRGVAQLRRDPDRSELRDPQVPPLRDRPHHQPHARLRLTDGHARLDLLRRGGRLAVRLARPHGSGVHPRGRGFHAGNSRPLQPA
jgi:hypothetical protein